MSLHQHRSEPSLRPEDRRLNRAEAEVEDIGDFLELELLDGKENKTGPHLGRKRVDRPLEMKEAFLIRLVWQGFGVKMVCSAALPYPEDIKTGIEEDAEKVCAEPRAASVVVDVEV